jgi:hypothetical protein
LTAKVGEIKMINSLPQVETEIGVDYTQLEQLLAAQKWEEADEETVNLMLKITNRENPGWLDLDSLTNFPCDYLKTIDRLWLESSNERFGFSVQKRVFQEVGKDYYKMGDRLGWRRGGEWLYYRDLTFDLSAPVGHLPLIPFPIWSWHPLWGFLGARSAFFVLFKSLGTCQI